MQDSDATTTSSAQNGNGGYVHPSLNLEGIGPSRGVVATDSIRKGELLIRIPSDRVLSGEETSIEAGRMEADAEAKAQSITVSPWLRCVGAFLRAKQSPNTACHSQTYEPYLRSLPAFEEYETLQQWSLEDEVEPFLRGTTLGSLVRIDRETQGIQTRYRQSVKPYLRRIGAIHETEKGSNEQNEAANDKDIETETKTEAVEDKTYQCFLEASMCISTRGFHLLPTANNDSSNTNSRANTNDKYGGPFLLPVIDLLNHDPRRACTTLRRYATNNNTQKGTSCFQMIAERDILEGEELFHSYGTDLTSAQLLQTFGFVPREHSERYVDVDVDVEIARTAPMVVVTSTPVGLRTRDHFVAAARRVKESSFPKSLVRRLQQTQGRAQKNNTQEENEDDEDEDCFWDVHEIPDRPMMSNAPEPGNSSSAAEADEEVLIAARATSGKAGQFLLTESLITLIIAQFLPEDAFLEIFPGGNNDTDVRLDRSILMEDWYLGMLVCQSLLVAIGLKCKEYRCVADVLGTESDKTKADLDTNDEKEATNAVRNSASGNIASAIGRRLSSMLRGEAGKIENLLQKKANGNDRELYGRTIRIEEMKNLAAFCDEIETLMSSLSLDDDGSDDDDDEKTGDDHRIVGKSSLDSEALLPPSKKPKME